MVSSEIALPELTPVLEEAGKNVVADVSITIGKTSAQAILATDSKPHQLSYADGCFIFHIPGVGGFAISNGSDIVVSPEPGADQDSIRLFLLGSAFGALLHQRGYLVLHGNAIQVGDGCIICVGPSGAGKSTLAAEFMRRGFAVLADDVVPVNQDCQALPSFPRIKLWADAASRLSLDTAGLSRIRPGLEKFSYPTALTAQDQPLGVRAIFELGILPSEEIELDQVRGMRRFEVIDRNTYRKQYLQAMALLPAHMGMCAALAQVAPVYRLNRPQGRDSASLLADRILGML